MKNQHAPISCYACPPHIPHDIHTGTAHAVTALIRLLVIALKPAKIYRLQHESHTCTCARFIDLLIILPNTCTRPLTEYEPVLELAGIEDQQVCCSVYRAHTIIEWIKKGHPFFCRHLTLQNLVYDDGTIAIPEVAVTVRQAMAQEVKKQFALFFNKARDCFRCALYLYRKPGPPSPVIVFLLHQAIELGYRSVLENLNGYCKKTHEIRVLKKQTRRCAPSLGGVWPDNTQEERRLLSLLEAAYSASRYNNEYCIENEDLSTLLKRVKLFLGRAAALFESTIAL